MKVKAAVAHKAAAPLSIDMADLEGLFPAILGQEGAGVVV